jgi:hypothetical protein
MKNLFLILTLVVILTSCNEYTSKFPISIAETSSSYQKLLGKWKFVSHSQDTSNSWDNKLGPHILQVTKFNKNEFLLECFSTLDSTLIIKEYMKKTHLGRGWVSKIKNEYLVTLTPIGKKIKEIEFFTYHISFKGDTLISKSISDKLFKSLNFEITSIKDHHEFIKLALDKPNYWKQQYKYVK